MSAFLKPAKQHAASGGAFPSPRAYLLAAIGLFLICALLRLGLAGRHGLWADELFSLAMATGHSLEHPAAAADPSAGDYVELPDPVSPAFYAQYLEHRSPPVTPARVVRAVFLSDTSPPGYYVLLYFWTLVVGTGDLSLRGFSLFWGLATLPIVWPLARQLGGRRTALAAGAIYTLSPLCVYYSVEGRMYSMLWFWTAALMWVSLRLHRDERGRAAASGAWIAASAAGFLTHYFFVFVWLAITLWLMIHPGRARRSLTLAAAGLAGLLIAPWYLRVPASLENWRVTGDWLNLPPGDNYNLFVQALLVPWSSFSPQGTWGVRERWDLLAACVYLVFALIAFTSIRWCTARRQLPLFVVAGACLGPVAFDLARGTYVTAVTRYAIAGLPAALILLAIGVAHARLPYRLEALARPAVVRGAFALAVVGIFAIGLRRMFVNPARALEPTHTVGRKVAEQLASGDLVLVHSIPSGVAGMARYLERYRPAETPAPAFAGWTGQLGQRQVTDDIERLIEGRRRVILIVVHPVGAPATELDWLSEHATLRSFYYEDPLDRGIGVFEFVPREGELFLTGR